MQDMAALGKCMKLKLIHKLLIAMFACTALVLVLITLVTRAGVGRGFVDFLQQQERGQLQLLVPDLVEWYGDRGNWDELASHPREFYDLVFSALLKGNESGVDAGLNRTQVPLRNGRRAPRPPGPGPGPFRSCRPEPPSGAGLPPRTA